uniref:receptor protein-tyrosine kinase n=1 Tax=Acrobeloides nanus TaxID=290746 RepID=A0A914ENQ2_9BILA
MDDNSRDGTIHTVGQFARLNEVFIIVYSQCKYDDIRGKTWEAFEGCTFCGISGCINTIIKRCESGSLIKAECPLNEICVISNECNASCRLAPSICSVEQAPDSTSGCMLSNTGLLRKYSTASIDGDHIVEGCKFCKGRNAITRKFGTCTKNNTVDKTEQCASGNVCVETRCEVKCVPIAQGCFLTNEPNSNETEQFPQPYGCNTCHRDGYKILSCSEEKSAYKFVETPCPVGTRCVQVDECEANCELVDPTSCEVGNKHGKKDYKRDGCVFCKDEVVDEVYTCKGREGIQISRCTNDEQCSEVEECRAKCQNNHSSLIISNKSISATADQNVSLPFYKFAIIINFIFLTLLTLLLILQHHRLTKLKKKFKIFMAEKQANMNQLVLIKANELDISKKKVGGGEFGNVFSGKYLNNGKKIPVAVKILKGVEEQELIKEAGIMAQLDHPHLTKLFGICLAEEIKIVAPLRPLGSLETYLKKNHDSLEPKELLLYCHQIASAMEYLVSRHIIHRDLASRNVLVKKRDHIEVTDFGLSAVLHQNLILPSKMPYRWVAMELLGQPRDKALYSEATDVWSFGITCWEILTFARIPYEGVRLDGPNVLASLHIYLKNGSRLIRPVNCSLELYQTLLLCWAPNPITRHKFKVLREQFEAYKEDPHKYVTTQKNVCVVETIIDEDGYFGKALYEKLEKSGSDEIPKINEEKQSSMGRENVQNKSIDNQYTRPPKHSRSESNGSYLSVISDHGYDFVDAPNFCTSMKLFGDLSYMNAGLKKRTR